MNKINSVILNDNDIKRYYSDYLNNGRKAESWRIERVEIENDLLKSKIKINSAYFSNTDQNQFHLTIFTTLEFVSQLMIIYGHVWAGLERKSQEGWMVDSQIRAVKAIRNPDAIKVEMKIGRIRKQGKKGFCTAKYTITDDGDGLFEGSLKGFLS